MGVERGRHGEGHLSRPLIYLSLQGLGWRGEYVRRRRRRVGSTLSVGQRFISFLYREFVSSVFGEFSLQGLNSLDFLITPIDFPELIGFC